VTLCLWLPLPSQGDVPGVGSPEPIHRARTRGSIRPPVRPSLILSEARFVVNAVHGLHATGPAFVSEQAFAMRLSEHSAEGSARDIAPWACRTTPTGSDRMARFVANGSNPFDGFSGHEWVQE